MIGRGRVWSINFLVIAGAAFVALAGCTAGSSGGSSGEAPESPGTSVTSSGAPVVAIGCPVHASAVSAAVKTQVAEVNATRLQSPDVRALCAFQTPLHTPPRPSVTVEIGAFPFKTGRYKNFSLGTIKDGLKAANGEGLTTRVTEHPEWGADAFSALLYNAGRAEAVQVWTTKYWSQIELPGEVSDSVYLADATNMGNALFAAS